MTAPATIGQSAEEIIRSIIADITLTPANAFGLDDDLPRTLRLDSLSLLRVVADIENAFGIHIDDARFHELRTLRELVKTVRQFGNR